MARTGHWPRPHVHSTFRDISAISSESDHTLPTLSHSRSIIRHLHPAAGLPDASPLLNPEFRILDSGPWTVRNPRTTAVSSVAPGSPHSEALQGPREPPALTSWHGDHRPGTHYP